jgi:hypothetical protein
VFDYCAVLIAVILGLALIHPLRGLAKLIQMRHEVTPYWVHIVWTFNAMIWVLSIWLGMFWWRGLQTLTTDWFFFLTAYAIIQFVWAAMLYPPEFSGKMNFEHYFYSNRYWFFGILAGVVLMDIPETLVKSAAHLRPMPVQYPFLISFLLIICAAALLTAKRRVHAVLSVAWLLLTLGYEVFVPLMSRLISR